MTQACAGGEVTAGFVLAGGQSRRMGRDKSLVEFAGETLIERALKILRQAGLDAGCAVRIAGGRAELENFAPVVGDAEPGRGPLGGICAALAASEGRRAVFVPVDLPLLPSSLITYMVRITEVTSALVVAVSVNGFAQTFPVVIGQAALPALRNALKQGSGGCYAALQDAAAGRGERIKVVPVEYLAQAGQVAHPDGLPPAMWFLNVNSPAGLRRAEAASRRAIA